MLKNHQFHLVDVSPWPLVISLSLFSLVSGSSIFFNTKNYFPLMISCLISSLVSFLWWRDVHRESTFQGHHTFFVTVSMKYGMILFIASEIFFFFSFFWSFFHHSLSPNQEIGLIWPPCMITTFNPLHIPLVNTIVLLSSGVSVSWAHSSMVMNNFNQTKISLILTIMLGLYFTFLQSYEYMDSSFCISDSVYGSTFFLTTGFHGLHVIVGTLFLIHSYLRLNKLHFNKFHHIGLELAIWYWHFVDIVWLFVYTFMYWWGI
uniref:Cytochrome c oxidase subunit 3 n=1 Tax=Blastopsylla occidentalis TaxID=121832 RepID=A0A2U9QJK0_BLAOC|nr:cytochrome c oxidase subunit 3 [Blastopsylla occidentalis]AWU48862.1 cytochrome c oxidase subunit 3 [Blastopsylla occidentalis]